MRCGALLAISTLQGLPYLAKAGVVLWDTCKAQKLPTQPAIRFPTTFPRKNGETGRMGGNGGNWGRKGESGGKWGKMGKRHTKNGGKWEKMLGLGEIGEPAS